MSRIIKTIIMVTVVAFSVEVCQGGKKVEGASLTHADAAVILAKYSGYFDRYVAEDASLDECVSFLNRTGVYFGLMEVINGSVFTKKDCAKALGQVSLVLSGEAEYVSGKIKLPVEIGSWEEFCMLNRVDYVGSYQTMLDMLIALYEQKE